MTTSKRTLNRRGFLGSTLAAAPTLLTAAAWGQSRVAPSGRITLGIIGLGSRGFNLIDAFLAQPAAQIVAICDVDSMHYRDRPWGTGAAYGCEPARQRIAKQSGSVSVYSDYRELIARDDLDAVVVATPDHWHALCTLQSLQAGKDVYCEKPVTHFFHEGQRIYREVATRKAVFQTGSQQRSDAKFRHAVELVRNGVIGKVLRVEVGLPTGYDKPQGETTVLTPPDHLDYDFWCGPAPQLPYMQARHHRWWRGHRAFGGGVLMDWIGHHNDIAHWALDVDARGPTRVEAVGWTFPDTAVYNTPQDYEIRCEYAGGTVSSISTGHRGGTKWIGEDGWIFVTRGRLEASDARWTKLDFAPGPIRVYDSPDHARNFVDCVKSRQPCIAPAETAHRSITPGHLGYVSNTVGRPLRWDAATEKILDDPEADALLHKCEYRAPWDLDPST